MGSVGRFVLLLAAGVFIMVVFVRSGESLGVLVLSLATFGLGLAAYVAQPWHLDRDRAGDGEADDATGAVRRRDDRWDGTWRCGHDVTWDERGVRGVAVGDRLPHLTVWSRVDGIGVGRHRDEVDQRGPQQRRGLRLDLYRGPGGGVGTTGAGPHTSGDQRRNVVWLCVGPDQDPDRVADELGAAWRRVAAQRRYPEPER